MGRGSGPSTSRRKLGEQVEQLEPVLLRGLEVVRMVQRLVRTRIVVRRWRVLP